jgi:hypothetical protein
MSECKSCHSETYDNYRCPFCSEQVDAQPPAPKTIEEEAEIYSINHETGMGDHSAYLGYIGGARREREKLRGLLGEARKISEGRNCYCTSSYQCDRCEFLARIAAELEKP